MRVLSAILGVWLMILGCPSSSFALPREVKEPFELNYGVEDPAFLATMNHLLGAGFVPGNKITDLINGEEVFPAMLEAIRQAETSINLENYIWSKGSLSTKFVEALSEKARQGVRVQVLTDCLGSVALPRKEIRKMRGAGVEVVLYNQPWLILNPVRANHRTHRKLLIVDGKMGFIGGICISDKWLGDAGGPPLWRDNHYQVEGPVVGQIQAVFADNWLIKTGKILHGASYYPPLTNQGPFQVQCFKSGPGEGIENARFVHLYSVAAARKSIRISHSYFIPDPLLEEELIRALKRGVKVEILVPGKIGLNSVQRAARSRWKKLLEAGVEFYTYQRSYFHCKVLIVDDIWVSTGSVNLDRRSFRINDEANINVFGREFAARQVGVFEEDKKNSRLLSAREFNNRPWYIKLCESVAGLFRYQL